ncbi:MAG: hypothetical protein ACQERJ_09245, partial [Bacillota bacterium]
DYKVAAVRIQAYARGASGKVDKTYYLALDEKNPEITGKLPMINVEDLAELSETDQIDELNNNSTPSDTPQLELEVDNQLSEVSNDNIMVRGIELNKLSKYRDMSLANIIEEFSTKSGAIIDDQEFNAMYNQDFEVSEYSTGEIKKIKPDGDLNDGIYVIRITAKDNAGNYNDQTSGNLTGNTFLLNVNTASPTINNIELKDSDGREVDDIISSEGGKMQFDVRNYKELHYQIRRRDQRGESWTTRSKEYQSKIDYDNIDQSFDDLGITLEDGTYEVIMVADDIELQDPVIEAISGINIEEGTNIEEEVTTAIEDEMSNEGLRLNDARTEISAFRFKVDGTPPTIGGIKYVNPNNGEIEDPNDDGTFGILYTATPTFQVTITDRSPLGDLDIEIDDILAGIVKQRTETVDGERVNTIQFTPNTPLSDGVHSIKIDVEDKWGNPLDEGDDPYEETFDNIFETQNVAKGITFNVNNGDRLSVKEASAIEITLPQDKNLDKSTLEVKVNGKTVVEGKDKASGIQDFEIISFNDWDRFILFALQPLPRGKNEIVVTVDDQRGNTTGNDVTFTADLPREGFGFGRLGKFMLEKAKKMEDAQD